MEEKILTLTKNLQELHSTLNKQFQHEINKADLDGGGTSSGRNPADAAQPEIKETIHSIQAKLDQLDNRTQVSHGAFLHLEELNAQIGIPSVQQSDTDISRVSALIYVSLNKV